MTECVYTSLLRCARARFASVYVHEHERVAEGGGYISPSEQRIIAVEWHDHTDGWKGRWREKGWEGGWKRGANKKLDRVVSGEKLQGKRRRCRNTEYDGERRQQVHPLGIVPACRKYSRARSSVRWTRLVVVKSKWYTMNITGGLEAEQLKIQGCARNEFIISQLISSKTL